jgi:hypothetical protein
MKIDPKKAVKSDPDVQPVTATDAATNPVAIRAYELWIERGCPVGSPEVDWYQAEEEVRGAGA